MEFLSRSLSKYSLRLRSGKKGGWLDRSLVFALLLCVAIRLIYSFLIFPVIGDQLHWRGVDDRYDEIARNLLHGEGYAYDPSAPLNLRTPPGYVFFLYLLYGALGEEVDEGIRIQLVQPLLDAGTCLLIFLLGCRVFRSRRAGVIGALAWALYPQMIVYNARVAPEVLFTFLLTATVLVWLRLLDEGKLGDAVLVGLLWGLAALVKEKLVFFPILLLFSILRSAPSPQLGRRLLLGGVCSLVMAATLTPWLVRMYRVTDGMIVPITTRAGPALDQGQKESFAGADTMTVHYHERERERETRSGPTTEEERAQWAARGAREERGLIGESLARIAGDPFSFLRAFFVKLAAFWYFGQPKVIIGNMAVQLPILFLAIAGYITGWRHSRLSPFLLLTAYFLVIHALTIVRMRYSIPIMPETILVAISFVLARLRKPAQA